MREHADLPVLFPVVSSTKLDSDVQVGVLFRRCVVLLVLPRFMRLDAAASRALNVLPQRLDGSASFSLYGIMARGKTAMGKRLLKVSAAGSTLCAAFSGFLSFVF